MCHFDSFYDSDLHHDMSHRPRQPQSSKIGPLVPVDQHTWLLAAEMYRDNKKAAKDQSTNNTSHLASRIVSRLYVNQLPGQELTADRLKRLLRRELADGTERKVAASIVDHLFPSTKLPFPVDDEFLDKLKDKWIDENGQNIPGVWSRNKFRDPPKEFTEEKFRIWMNHLAKAMSAATGKAVQQVWSHHTCNTLPVGSSTKCKPDLVLLDTNYLKCINDHGIVTDWALIRAFAEVTSQQETPPRIFDTVLNKSFLCFQCQPARRLTISLSFNGAGELSLTFADCEGLLWMPEICLLPDSGYDAALILLKMLAILMFGSEVDIGFDPNFEVHSLTGKIQAITVDNIQFKVKKLVYSLDSLVGRGTRVWIVKHGRRHLILKDAWFQKDRLESEQKFLNVI